MKNLFSIALLLLLICPAVMAQSPAEKKKEVKKEHHKETIDKEALEKGKRKHQSNNGKAHGKSKEGLSGKEFGQKRAQEAKSEKENLIVEIENSESIITHGEKKILHARMKLKKQLQNKEITQKEHDEKKATIDEAEEKLNQLKVSVKSKRNLLNKLNTSLR